jgi:hypothetical protein
MTVSNSCALCDWRDTHLLLAQALAEFHPLVFAALFGHDAAPANTQQVAA